MNVKLRIAIIESGFERQSDFAQAIGVSEPFVSNILRGRRKLTKDQSETWRSVLKCRPCILKNVTDN